MPLESVTSGHTNIKTLVLESPKPPERPSVFDPTPIVKKQDLSFIKQDIEELRGQEDPMKHSRLLYYLSAIKFIDPEYFATLETNKKLSSFNMTEALIALERKNTSDWVNYAASLSLLYPDHPSRAFVKEEVGKFMPKVSERVVQLLKESRPTYIPITSLGRSAISLRVHSQPLALDEQQFYLSILQRFAEEKERDIRGDHADSVADTASAIRILYPNKPITDYLTPQDWQFMEEGFMKRVINDKNWYGQRSFIPYAFHLKILAAEKVEFSPDQGMKLVMHGPKLELPQTAPMPGMRKF